jgi:ATP-dependent phosphofructokinase / diphosphate-dependent phosphofructokinase
MGSANNLLVAQSGGPTAVINSSLAGIISAAQRRGRIGKIIGLNGGIEGLLGGRLPYDLSNLSDHQLTALQNSNGMALGSCRFPVRDEHLAALRDYCRNNGVGYFLYMGGNGSMRTPLALSQLASADELICVGVPKTVDNDLRQTDFAPGYPSAARWLAYTARDAWLDLAGMRGFDNVKIIEAMGRHSGWLTAATVLARSTPGDGPQLVYLPEKPLDLDRFLQDVATVYEKQGVALIVVAEGIRTPEGTFIAELAGLPRDREGRALFGFTSGAVPYLCQLIIEKLGIKARFDRPGTLQRGAACVSELDRRLAYEIGAKAVQYALEGQTGKMVAIRRTPNDWTLEAVPLESVAGVENLFPDAWFLPDAQPDAQKFGEYALPLIGDALPEPARPDEYPFYEG